MKREAKELKGIARVNVFGSFSALVQAFLLSNLIVSVVEMPFYIFTDEKTFSTQNILYMVAMILIAIASVVFTVGQYCLHLRVARKEKLHFKEFYYPLKHDANRLICTEFILFLLELVAMIPALGALAIIYFYEDLNLYMLALFLSILGCVLSVFVSISFSLVYFVLIDGEELSVNEALKRALQLIKGHRGRFIGMHISFISSYLLVIFTLGIAIIWVQPYIMQTTTLFYLDITGELDQILSPAQPEEEIVPNL